MAASIIQLCSLLQGSEMAGANVCESGRSMSQRHMKQVGNHRVSFEEGKPRD